MEPTSQAQEPRPPAIRRAGQMIVSGILLASLTGCLHISLPWPKKKAAKKSEPEEPQIQDMSADQSFQSFVGRLREAVARRDYALIGSMMSPNFGYRWDMEQAPPNENVFQYWDQRGLWPELELVLREKFSPKGVFMVAPAQFAFDSENYSGYRAGIYLFNGSWKFAYFVGDQP